MSNFDLVVGLSQLEVSRLLAGYHASAPVDDNPFKGREEVDVLEQLWVIEWEVPVAPNVVLETPECSVWKAAQGEDGLTNHEAHRPRPKLPMLQLVIPLLDLKWGLKDAELEQGTSRNVLAHVTLDFREATIAMAVVALTIDQSEFEEFDKQLFNLLVLPMIFAQARKMLSVIHLPELKLGDDLLFKPLQISLVERCLLGATTLTDNPQPLDITDLTLPEEAVFLIVNNACINRALVTAVESLGNLEASDSGKIGVFANWTSYARGTPSFTLGTLSPLTFSGTADLLLDVEVTLSEQFLEMLNPSRCAMMMWGGWGRRRVGRNG